MNRQIKFRGKRISEGKWIYGYLADGYYINNINEVATPSEEVESHSVGQFTGLLDRNGKEIYEGDIIKSPCMNIVVVEFGYHEDVVRLKGMPFNDSFAAYGWIVRNLENGTSGFLDNSFLQGEIVGNIHDNPELLNPTKP